MRGRTRIIVTHALHLTMPLADYIVALSNGYVAFDGPAQDYVAASGANTPGLPSGQNFSTLSLKNLHLRSFTGQPPMDSDTVAEAAAVAADQAIEQHLPHLLDNPLTEEQLMARAEKQTTGEAGYEDAPHDFRDNAKRERGGASGGHGLVNELTILPDFVLLLFRRRCRIWRIHLLRSSSRVAFRPRLSFRTDWLH